MERDAFRETLDAQDGSLIRTLDQLVRPTGRSLRPFTPPHLTPEERELGETHALDPSKPEAMDKMFVKVLRVFTKRHFAAATASVLAFVGAIALDWRRVRS